MNHVLTEQDYTNFAPIIEHKDCAPITNPWKKRTVAQVLLNTKHELMSEHYARGGRMLTENPIPNNLMGASSSTASDGAIDIFDPILINLIRRAMPNLISYDIMGVQPMSALR